MAALVLKLTDAGLAAVQAAAGSDPVVISELGLTNTPFDYAPTLTALPGEFKRIGAVSGISAAANIAHLTAYDTSQDVWSATGLGLFLEDGTLFAVHSSPEPVQSKASLAFALISIDIIFNADLAADIAFGNAIFTSPPSTTEMRGIVELATIPEAQAGLDTLRALTPEAAAAAVFSWLRWRNLELGQVDVRTPNVGTTGGLRVRANQETGIGLLQFVTPDGTVEIGHLAAHPGGGLEYSGLLAVHTPNDGSTGGLRLHANPETGIAYFQVLGPGNDEELGFFRFDADGTANWSGVGGLKAGGHKVWTAGNDGAGSGLEADLLDGKDWFGGQDVGFGIVNCLTPNIGSTGGLRLKANPDSDNAFLQVLNPDGTERGFLVIGPDRIMSWNGPEFRVAGQKVWTVGNDGAGSDLDADLLDGQHGGFYTDIIGRLGYTPMNAASYNDFLRDVGSSLSENGYTRLSNGLMLCWGRFTTTPNNVTPVTFPMSFPNACFSVLAGGVSGGGADSQDNWPAVRTSTITTMGFSAFSANDASDVCTFIAVGF